jgi:hypothetical protein
MHLLIYQLQYCYVMEINFNKEYELPNLNSSVVVCILFPYFISDIQNSIIATFSHMDIHTYTSNIYIYIYNHFSSFLSSGTAVQFRVRREHIRYIKTIPRIIWKFGCHWGEQGKCLSGHCRNNGKLSGQGIA